MKVGGICGECGKYYNGDVCGNDLCRVSTASGQTFNVINDIPEHYNRGLGMVIRGRAQYQAELRRKGLVEVGNEKAYVSAERQEKLKERKTEALYADLREKAFRMIERQGGHPAWN